MGLRSPVCGSNFFINRGTGQPGCLNFFGFENIPCSHARAVDIFLEALKEPKSFYGLSCRSFQDALDGNCSSEPGAYILDPDNRNGNISRIFNVKTNLNPPYGMGKA